MRSHWLSGAAFVAVTGFLLTSTRPVHAAPVRSTHAIALTGHETGQGVISNFTGEAFARAAYVGATAGLASCGPEGAVVGAAVLGAGYAVLSAIGFSTPATPLATVPGVSASHIQAISDARLDSK